MRSRNSNISRVAGTGIWTHSYARSPRQSDGLIQDNKSALLRATLFRSATPQAFACRIITAAQIGFPVEYVDFPGYATPVALDTAGNVDHSVYSGNVFTAWRGSASISTDSMMAKSPIISASTIRR